MLRPISAQSQPRDPSCRRHSCLCAREVERQPWEAFRTSEKPIRTNKKSIRNARRSIRMSTTQYLLTNQLNHVTLLCEYSPPVRTSHHKNEILVLRASASPSFSVTSTLPKSVYPDLQHSKPLAHSLEKQGGIPPKANSWRNSTSLRVKPAPHSFLTSGTAPRPFHRAVTPYLASQLHTSFAPPWRLIHARAKS
jgi:hypothetical protein